MKLNDSKVDFYGYTRQYPNSAPIRIPYEILKFVWTVPIIYQPYILHARFAKQDIAKIYINIVKNYYKRRINLLDYLLTLAPGTKILDNFGPYEKWRF